MDLNLVLNNEQYFGSGGKIIQKIRMYHQKKMLMGEFSLCGLGELKSDIVSRRMWVQSLALLSGLRIWHCCKLQCRSQVQLRSGVAVAVA